MNSDNKNAVEQLENNVVETLTKTDNTEKIEIVEHVESKYDNIVPRTAISEMSKAEKEEIRRKVLGDDTTPSTIDAVLPANNNDSTEDLKLNKPGGNSLLKILVLVLAAVVVLGGFYIFLILPNM